MQNQDGYRPPCLVAREPGQPVEPGRNACHIPALDPLTSRALVLRNTLVSLQEMGAADALMRAEQPTARMLRFVARVNATITEIHTERSKHK